MLGVISTAFALALLLQPVPMTTPGPAVADQSKDAAPAQLTVSCDGFASTERGAGTIHLVRDVTASADGTFSVTLCSNGTTGFGWETPVLDSAAVAVVDHVTAGPADAQLIGAAGTETWTFRLLRDSGSSIDFAYSQPWSGGAKAVWTLHVDVLPGSAVAVTRSVGCDASGAVTGLVRPEPMSVRVGETFDVALCSNPSTGFAWKRVDLGTNPLRLLSNEMVPASGGLIGAAGTEKWTFKAVAPGDHALVFWYLRSWEGVPQLGVVWLMVHVTA